MLARSRRLPLSGDYAYEVKWDGFRAIASTEGPLRVRSRRGWDMAPHVGFLAELPVSAILDGELVALDEQGRPDFPLVCEWLLQHCFTIPPDVHVVRRAQHRRRERASSRSRTPSDV
jgi:ATP-dependent DNA ligase